MQYETLYGGERGVRGWLAALDVATGKILWRAAGGVPGFQDTLWLASCFPSNRAAKKQG